MVRGVAGEVQDLGGEVPDGEFFIVGEEMVEDGVELGGVDVIAPAEGFLDFGDALANADGGAVLVFLEDLFLQVARCCYVVGMRVRFKNAGDFVVVVINDSQQFVRGRCADLVRCGIEVQDGVNDNAVTCRRIGDDVLKGTSLRFEASLDFWFVFHRDNNNSDCYCCSCVNQSMIFFDSLAAINAFIDLAG